MASREAAPKRESNRTTVKPNIPGRLGVTILFAVLNVTLGLGVIKRNWFSSLSLAAYLWLVWDNLSLWAGRIVTIAGALSPFWIMLSRQRSTRISSEKEPPSHEPPAQPKESYLQRTFPFLLAYLAKRKVFLWTAAILIAPIPALTFFLITPLRPFPLSPSAVSISRDGQTIFVADEDNGKLRFYDALTGKERTSRSDIGGKPHRMIVGSRSGRLYLVDPSTDSVSVVDPESRIVVETLSVRPFHFPRSLVISPDERKLFVAVEHAPQGAILVIDLRVKGHPSHTIEGVNCPEALAISQDGRKLYAATQCGATRDPVFVIDTNTEVVTPIPGFAVGLDIALARGGKRIYVARGGFYAADSSTGAIVTLPPQLSVIDTSNEREKTEEALQFTARGLLAPAGSFAVTPDGTYLFAVVGSSIRIINTETYRIKQIDFSTPPAGVAVGSASGTKGLRCYVWLPREDRLFVTGLSGWLS